MATTVTSSIRVLLSSILANTVGIATAGVTAERSPSFALASGVGANQADKVYTASITRTHGAPAGDLDLAGSLSDALGVVITMARVKALIVIAAAANINSVIVGGGSSAPMISIFTDYVATAMAQPSLKVRPGGILCLVAPDATGYVLTASSADKLQIASGDEDGTTSVTAEVIIIGASA